MRLSLPPAVCPDCFVFHPVRFFTWGWVVCPTWLGKRALT